MIQEQGRDHLPSPVELCQRSNYVVPVTRAKTPTENIAEQVRALRQRKGWSVRQLADECAKHGFKTLTQSSLVNLERGLGGPDPSSRPVRPVTVEELLGLAWVLGANAADLMFPADAERVEVVPGQSVHPYVAGLWLHGRRPVSVMVGEYLRDVDPEASAIADAWGPQILDSDERQSAMTGWSNFDSYIQQVGSLRDGIKRLHKQGEDAADHERAYNGKLSVLAFMYEKKEAESLPAIPRWLYDDLQAAKAADDLKIFEHDSLDRTATPIARSISLPAGIPILDES